MSARMCCQRGHQPVPQRGNPLASEFIHSLPDKSVTLLDKGFFGADLLLRIQAEDSDRHWLIPERKGAGIHGT